WTGPRPFSGAERGRDAAAVAGATGRPDGSLDGPFHAGAPGLGAVVRGRRGGGLWVVRRVGSGGGPGRRTSSRRGAGRPHRLGRRCLGLGRGRRRGSTALLGVGRPAPRDRCLL